jgi:hypothetical protein
MGKVINAEKAIKKSLKENCACYVLITCSAPNAEGHMDIEMNYEGDEMLASFLIDNASQVFDERMQRKESK